MILIVGLLLVLLLVLADGDAVLGEVVSIRCSLLLLLLLSSLLSLLVINSIVLLSLVLVVLVVVVVVVVLLLLLLLLLADGDAVLGEGHAHFLKCTSKGR